MKPSLRRTINKLWPVGSEEIRLSREAAMVATASEYYGDGQSHFERVERSSDGSHTIIRVKKDGGRDLEQVTTPKGIDLTDDLVRELNSSEGKKRVKHFESIASDMIMGGIAMVGLAAIVVWSNANEEQPEPQPVAPVCESYVDGDVFLQDNVGSIATVQQVICESDQVAR